MKFEKQSLWNLLWSLKNKFYVATKLGFDQILWTSMDVQYAYVHGRSMDASMDVHQKTVYYIFTDKFKCDFQKNLNKTVARKIYRAVSYMLEPKHAAEGFFIDSGRDNAFKYVKKYVSTRYPDQGEQS